MKICTKCKIEKENIYFGKNIKIRSGLDSWCKSCYKEYNQMYCKKNSEILKLKKREYTQRPEIKERYNKKYRESTKIKLYNKQRNLIKNYNITLNEYNDMLKKQNECCFICKIHQSFLKIELCVDHNHITGKVRGLLCNSCNRGIGMLKEDIQILQNAIEYLKG